MVITYVAWPPIAIHYDHVCDLVPIVIYIVITYVAWPPIAIHYNHVNMMYVT